MKLYTNVAQTLYCWQMSAEFTLELWRNFFKKKLFKRILRLGFGLIETNWSTKFFSLKLKSEGDANLPVQLLPNLTTMNPQIRQSDKFCAFFDFQDRIGSDYRIHLTTSRMLVLIFNPVGVRTGTECLSSKALRHTHHWFNFIPHFWIPYYPLKLSSSATIIVPTAVSVDCNLSSLSDYLEFSMFQTVSRSIALHNVPNWKLNETRSVRAPAFSEWVVWSHIQLTLLIRTLWLTFFLIFLANWANSSNEFVCETCDLR